MIATLSMDGVLPVIAKGRNADGEWSTKTLEGDSHKAKYSGPLLDVDCNLTDVIIDVWSEPNITS
jgi:hypothetical protein